ncbi:m-AAA protease-interacting protein 1, mitochondrial [Tachyglossus aculeatus]|uniref:m-AAA protease-interacting protein 1, mitochondrial n=1 Tax=Tachyglossus aculeatus TaxID=9261 RepID=UPI0018F2E6A5|nr:m-AAA protease-interacting protein 1, mitochondrial [Tachyglossus aculeatus]
MWGSAGLCRAVRPALPRALGVPGAVAARGSGGLVPGGGPPEGSSAAAAVVVVGVGSPLRWVRTRLRAALVRAACDPNFSVRTFAPAATQAFAHVSKLLSQCKFDLLEELVSKEVLQMLKDKVPPLPDLQKSALAAEPDQIVYSTTGDISITYDDQGRKFVTVLMCFWYLTSADLPDEAPRGAKVFRFKLGDGGAKFKQLLNANYEFQREFTQGVEPDWTISRIEHPKLLD